MLNLKDLRKDLDVLKKKFFERNVEFDVDNFNRKDTLNRDLIIKKEKLEQEKKILSKSKDQDNFIKSKRSNQKSNYYFIYSHFYFKFIYLWKLQD